MCGEDAAVKIIHCLSTAGTARIKRSSDILLIANTNRSPEIDVGL
jgi:hypothetical protein